jgi:hypothetical protein
MGWSMTYDLPWHGFILSVENQDFRGFDWPSLRMCNGSSEKKKGWNREINPGFDFDIEDLMLLPFDSDISKEYNRPPSHLLKFSEMLLSNNNIIGVLN